MMNVKLIKGYMPELYIYNDAMNKMEEYIRQSDLEIGWLGCATKEDGNYYIEDVFLFKQEVHSTTTEITTEGLNEFAMEILQEEDGMEKWNNMRVWGHSHVNMSTHPSSQDESQMDLFLENTNEFFIRIIANKKGDYNISIYDYEVGICYEKVPYKIYYDRDVEQTVQTITNQIKILKARLEELVSPSKEMVEGITQEIKDKVKKKTYTNVKGATKYGAYQGYYDYGNYSYYGKPKSKKKETKEYTEDSIVYDVDVVFDTLSINDIFTIMECIESGGTSEDLLTQYYFPNETSDELDDLIMEYCEANITDYQEWLEGEIL